jgi:hypothetical protein
MVFFKTDFLLDLRIILLMKLYGNEGFGINFH